MKFAALALTLLLAVGSQAAVAQTGTVSECDQAFAQLRMVTERMKIYTSRLDDTEYSLFKPWMEHILSRMEEVSTERKEEMCSIAETVRETISETFGFDYERVKAELTPMFAQLRIAEHIDQYIVKLGPILTEIATGYYTATQDIVPRIKPGVDELRDTFRTNAMDTSEKLMPILAVIQRELSAFHIKVREMVEPYVQEYREQMTGVVQRLRSLTPEEVDARREEVKRIGTQILEKFTELGNIVFRE